ncbi:hypothetical protein Tco_0122593 [Tanacetum coccineum]
MAEGPGGGQGGAHDYSWGQLSFYGQASAIQELPSLVDTFYRMHTVNGVFANAEEARMYDEMLRLQATGGTPMSRSTQLFEGLDEKRQWYADAFARYDSGGASGSGAGGSRGTDEGDADEGLDLVVDDTS